MPVHAAPCNTYVDFFCDFSQCWSIVHLSSTGVLQILFFFKQTCYTNTIKYWRLLFRIRISNYKLYKYRYSRQRIKTTWNSQSKTFLHTAVPVQAMNLKRSITFEKTMIRVMISYNYEMIMILAILLISCLMLFTIIFICFFQWIQ